MPPTAVVLIAGVLATAFSWTAGEVAYGRFAPSALADPMLGPTAGGASSEDIHRGLVLEATLTYAVQGAVLGLLLGLAGAAAGGSKRSAAVGGVAGLVLGGLVGAGAAFGLASVYLENADPISHDLLLPLATHASLWGLIGGVGGLALGLGGGGGGARVAKAAVGGLVGGAIGAAAYEILGAILFPLARTSEPVADSTAARLFAHATTNVLAALVAAMALADPGRPKKR
ncbi:hypothetical protein [Tautonia plasticadhaerens]|nr:hypothetical protein [Tautonia plasticadhaerens]